MTREPAPDIAIIGGGIVGTAAAAFLADTGARVTLFEQSSIAAGASGRNSGVIQHPFDPVLVELYRESLALYRELAAESPDFRLGAEPAGLLLIGDAAAESTVTDIAAAWISAFPDARPEVVAGEALRRLDPALGYDLAACRLAVGYPVAPASATLAFAALAEARGARMRIGERVGLALAGNVVVGIEVDERVEPAGTVIVAAGPWTPAIVDPTGRWRPIRSVWGVVAETRLVDPPRHVLEEVDIDIEPGEDVETPGAGGVGFSLATADGTSALGSTFLDDEPDPGAYVDALRVRGARYVPNLAEAPVVGLRACARPVAVDGRPLIGAVAGLRGAFVAAGNGPWGISTGPATGRIVADLVLGGTSRAGVPRELDAARFPR